MLAKEISWDKGEDVGCEVKGRRKNPAKIHWNVFVWSMRTPYTVNSINARGHQLQQCPWNLERI